MKLKIIKNIELNKEIKNIELNKEIKNIELNKVIKNNELNKEIKNIELQKKIKNQINIKLKIENKDINKDIYFLDNSNHKHIHLTELNESNTELYINNIKYKYQKYFKPEKKEF